MNRPKVYTREGDDGTTGLFYGGRVPKDSELPRAYGTVDEAQAVLGLTRAAAGVDSEVSQILIPIMKDLWVLMAELATLPENRGKLEAGSTAVSSDMVDRLERIIDSLDERFEPPNEFVVGSWAHSRASCGAPFAGCGSVAIACCSLFEPTLRSAVDHGPLAGGHFIESENHQ
jgi:ATP:cob(I)alamin adenosyltransferase